MKSAKINRQKPLSLKSNERASGIELLKILAIFLIIISHMNQTLTAYSATAESVADYVINLKEFVLLRPFAGYFLYLFQHFGQIGNDIFFVCSAWFLTDSTKTYGKKIARLMIEVWFVSVLILVIVFVSNTVQLHKSSILRSIFPTTFQNNWYITSYILFLAIVPFLNLILKKLSQKKHLFFVLFVSMVYIFVDPFTTEFSSSTIRFPIGEWVVIFFVIAYIKKYCAVSSLNVPKNCMILLTGLAVYAIVNYANAFSYDGWNLLPLIMVVGWSSNNIFRYVIAIALLNLFRGLKFHNKLINKVSKYSLLIYVIHENLLIRQYYRPLVLTWIYKTLGYNHIVLWILILAMATFIGATILSAIVDATIGKLSGKITDSYYSKFRTFCSDFLEKMIKQN